MQKQMVKDKREGKSIEGEVDCRLLLAYIVYSTWSSISTYNLREKRKIKQRSMGKPKNKKGGARELVPASKKLVLRMMAKNP